MMKGNKSKTMKLFLLSMLLCIVFIMPAHAQEPNAQVIDMWGVLNLRQAPSRAGAIIGELPGGTPLIVTGRTSNNAWYAVQTLQAQQGWVASGYVELLRVELDSLPILTPDAVAVSDSAPNSATPTSLFTLNNNARTVFAAGQRIGNRRNVFSKVGDSITVAEVMYYPIGYRAYTLGGYTSLQTTIDFFMREQARDNNSFNNTSLAAGNGWTTATVLNPQFANPQVCQSGEIPLVCEYRTTRPAVALIMLGSNDVARVPAEEFANNLRVIVQISIENGVIPVLSTIPPRRDYEAQVEVYNQIIINTANEHGASLWDYYTVMQGLPDGGLSSDGLHPSAPPFGFGDAANFTDEYLRYGYVMRNLTALQVLDALRQRVLQ